MLNFRIAASLMLLMMFSSIITAQETKIPAQKTVMTLGVFHFNFPNLDVKKIEKKDQIDVLDEEYQNEIKDIVEVLKKFKPTAIVIEIRPEFQKRTDSLYNAYRQGDYKLQREEVDQIGFRLADELVIKKLYCVDTWGKFYEDLKYLFNDSSSRAAAFDHYYFNNPDTIYSNVKRDTRFSADKGVLENLIAFNNPQTIKESLGSYITGHFKYEETEGDYTGTDFETCRWFSRNLRILRNIQRIPKTESDRILVIYGAGHLNILNYLFECSPEYQLVSPVPYLRNAKEE